MQELDEMKRKLREMEEEAAALREMQSKVEKEMGVVAGISLRSILYNDLFSYFEFFDEGYAALLFL
jgi:hypothetical protein